MNSNGGRGYSAEADIILNSSDGEPRARFEAFEATFDNGPDLVCFSHLRWNFVYQRPQHLMSRCARERRVFFFEEPIPDERADTAWLDLNLTSSGVCVAVPRLPGGLTGEARFQALKQIVDELFVRCGIHDCVLWYYTPMMLPFTRHLKPLATVYDCMDELTGFKGAPPQMRENEHALLERADLVFTGGHSLYEAKRHLHGNIHAFPSSIDTGHFGQARTCSRDPLDQRPIPRPRLGFAGVIDERMNIELVRRVAELRPDWHVLFVGPVVKINPEDLPMLPNIHYLGAKKYEDLPAYIAGWDVAILPFAHNGSTRFISPTKTPEYLAAGKRVVSTSIRDVVRTYGEPGYVDIADTAEEWVSAVQKRLTDSSDHSGWLSRVDAALSENSWGRTWGHMMSLLESAIASRNAVHVTAARPVAAGLPATGMRDLRPTAGIRLSTDWEDQQ